ncbi:MAG: ferredoxin family protein [Clostridiales Family XIII bacterium]|nr:ferredoxin family protein [Clostridiales Family XIII bacterium]
MKINNIYAAFFSPTGTTEKIVRAISGHLSDAWSVPLQAHDFTLPAARGEGLFFGRGSLAVIGVPTYAGRVPNVLLPYIQEKIRADGALAVPVAMFGNRAFDDALIELRDLLEQAGFRTVAAAAFVGEHSFSRTLAAGRPDEKDLAVAEAFAAAVASRVDAMQEAPSGPVSVSGHEPLRPYYKVFDTNGEPVSILKVKPKVSDACTRCGLCARICPMGSIDASDVTAYTGICIKCGACEKRCPVGARYYDDAGYLYHKQDLEARYARRAEPEIFASMP